MSNKQQGDNPRGGDVQSVIDLRARVRRSLAPIAEFSSPTVTANGDDSIAFEYAGSPCAVRAVQLAEGLDVLSMTCVLAWDLPLDAGLRSRVGTIADGVQFGSVNVVERDDHADVVLQYTFPAGGLEQQPLTTMLLLVLSGVREARGLLVDERG